jgi:hypothetical protein
VVEWEVEDVLVVGGDGDGGGGGGVEEEEASLWVRVCYNILTTHQK